jgi:hypothetical protein
MSQNAIQEEMFISPRFNSFLRFHKNNPKVYQYFEARAFEMIQAGHKNFSARTILEVARWDINLQTNGKPFKIDNNHVPFYAKMFMKANPQHEGFFRTRD